MKRQMINADRVNHSEMQNMKEMIAMKRANNKKYAKQLRAELATYAYKRCYKTRRHRSDKGGTRRHSHAAKNTRDEKCSAKGWTACGLSRPVSKARRKAVFGWRGRGR